MDIASLKNNVKALSAEGAALRAAIQRAAGPERHRLWGEKRRIGGRARLALLGYGFARASSASLTSIFRSSPGLVTRSGKSSRNVLLPAWRSIPSGSQPVQRQSAASAPSSLVA